MFLRRFVALAYVVALLGDRQPSLTSSTSQSPLAQDWSEDQWFQVCTAGLAGLQDEVTIII